MNPGTIAVGPKYRKNGTRFRVPIDNDVRLLAGLRGSEPGINVGGLFPVRSDRVDWWESTDGWCRILGRCSPGDGDELCPRCEEVGGLTDGDLRWRSPSFETALSAVEFSR